MVAVRVKGSLFKAHLTDLTKRNFRRFCVEVTKYLRQIFTLVMQIVTNLVADWILGNISKLAGLRIWQNMAFLDISGQ